MRNEIHCVSRRRVAALRALGGGFSAETLKR